MKAVRANLGPLPLDVASAAPAGPLEWSFNPWHEGPGGAALAAALALALCAIVILARQAFVPTLSLCLVAAGALSPALTPLLCRIDEQGVARRGPLGWEKRAWSEIRRAVVRGAGLLVSPYRQRHWLDAHRGLLLPLPAASRADLVLRIRPHLDRHGL
ncbi:MAG: hypothetical protein HYR73_09765 [Candidatus Eisenbacteria bacterium]|nr:hypothetical protein [Candidatus Eisenbacteria bacterium]